MEAGDWMNFAFREIESSVGAHPKTEEGVRCPQGGMTHRREGRSQLAGSLR